MSMTTKRKAQDLVRKGKIQEAIEQMREGVSEGNADPYDHVYLGDLLMRTDEKEEGLVSYETAIRSYEEVGLFRNAIAIGKKLLRADDNRHEVHRTLGRLYDRDDLQGEAIPHYLCYLDSLSGETVPPQEFLEILDRAASITGSKVEVALRLTDHFLRLAKGERAAALLDSVADHCDRAGSEEIAADLRQRAREAALVGAEDETNPDTPTSGVLAGPVDDGHVTIDLDSVDLNVTGAGQDELPPIPLDDSLFGEPDSASHSTPEAPDEAPGETAEQFAVEHFPAQGDTPPAADPLEFDSVDLTAELMEAALGTPDASESDSADESEGHVFELDLDEPDEFGAVDLGSFSEGAPGSDGETENVWDIEEDDSPTEFGEVDLASSPETSDRDELETLDFGTAPAPTSLLGPIEDEDEDPAVEMVPQPPADAPEEVTLEAADDDYLEGRWLDARFKYEAILDTEPNQRRILSKLVEVVRYLEDVQGEIHYQILLGDAWILEEEYEEAMNCFLAVLNHDPENQTAKRRLARFRDLGISGASEIDEATSNSVPSLLETGGTEVAVKNTDNTDFRSEDWVELEGLLEEFKSGLKEQMDETDYQAHYDLAVSHHSMGLLDEALESIDLALACSEIPAQVQRQVRELRGGCLLGLQRNREAVHEFRETLDQAGTDVQARRTALHNLGRALESVEEWQEAYQTFSQLRSEAPGHLDVEERMHRLEERLSDRGNPAA